MLPSDNGNKPVALPYATSKSEQHGSTSILLQHGRRTFVASFALLLHGSSSCVGSSLPGIIRYVDFNGFFVLVAPARDVEICIVF